MNTMTNIQTTTAKLLINGQFVESTTSEWQDIINPATQEVVGRVPMATPDEVEAAINAAQDALKLAFNPDPGTYAYYAQAARFNP